MKMLHTLKTSWFILAMVVAVVIGEVLAWQLSLMFDVRISEIGVGAVCVGLVAFVVSLIYDGTD